MEKKGKEYNKQGKLLFEGEYLYNYKYKGKGYHKGKLDIEGEYLFDKKWDGKEYDENGNLINEIKNGNGKVKEYDNNDRLIYEGEYLNGEKWNGNRIYYALGKNNI